MFVVGPADQVADVVKVRGDRRQLRRSVVSTQASQDVRRDAGGQVGVPQPVLGVADDPGILVGLGEERIDFGVALDVLEGRNGGPDP